MTHNLQQPGAKLIAEIEGQNGLSRACSVLILGLEAVDSAGRPDWRVRQESARQILDRVDGRPIERQMVQHQHVKAPPSLASLVRAPGAVDTLRGLLAQAEQIVADGSKAVDVESVTPDSRPSV